MAKKSKSKKRPMAKAKRRAAKKSVAKKKARPVKVKAKAKAKVAKKAAPKKAKPKAKVAPKKAAPKQAAPKSCAEKSCSEATCAGADRSGTDGGTARDAGRGDADIDDSQHGTDGVLRIAAGHDLGAYQPFERARAAAVREYSSGKRLRIDVHMLVEHGFEHAAQIERRPQIAVVEQRRARKTRPVGDHATAAYGSARRGTRSRRFHDRCRASRSWRRCGRTRSRPARRFAAIAVPIHPPGCEAPCRARPAAARACPWRRLDWHAYPSRGPR